MPLYSPPSLIGGAERGRGRICAHWPARLRPSPARGVADVRAGGVPRPTPRVAAVYMRAGRRARARPWRGGRGRTL